jgi:hypothetical protein
MPQIYVVAVLDLEIGLKEEIEVFVCKYVCIWLFS